MTDYRKIADGWDTYDYESSVKEDAKEAILEYIAYHGEEGDLKDTESVEDLRDDLIDTLYNEDSVTGNGSGSYTFSRIMADLYLVNNGYLYEEALEEMGGKFDPEPENRDIVIRCYLLPRAIDELLEDEEIIKAFNDAKGATNED